MKHLYQQIFVTVVGVALVCAALVGLAAHWFDPRDEMRPFVSEAARYLVDDLPDSPREMRRELRRRAHRAHVAMTLWSADGARRVARAGPPLPRPDASRTLPYHFESRAHVGVVLRLDDGRLLVVGHHRPPEGPGASRLVLALVLASAFVLLGSYWAARRITRRLEALGEGVRQLGQGDRAVQVEVRGDDEVAALARQFNAASARIAALLEQQARVLAGASHELRSPLARLRMALELLASGGEDEASAARRALVEECARDIAELDALIDDILLGARLRDAGAVRHFAEVDLAALVERECARTGATAQVQPCVVQGDARALSSLVRNLLENAARHGAPPVRARLTAGEARVEIAVEDAGAPLDATDRERIFEPFVRRRGHAEGQGGAGLGLSLVRDIARHHGGEVRYAVSPSGGSCFHVDLARG